jgi:hypothetical protein
MILIIYVVKALGRPTSCHSAVNALRDLCDANITRLTRYIAAFGQLYANIDTVPVRDKVVLL